MENKEYEMIELDNLKPLKKINPWLCLSSCISFFSVWFLLPFEYLNYPLITASFILNLKFSRKYKVIFLLLVNLFALAIQIFYSYTSRKLGIVTTLG